MDGKVNPNLFIWDKGTYTESSSGHFTTYTSETPRSICSFDTSTYVYYSSNFKVEIDLDNFCLQFVLVDPVSVISTNEIALNNIPTGSYIIGYSPYSRYTMIRKDANTTIQLRYSSVQAFACTEVTGPTLTRTYNHHSFVTSVNESAYPPAVSDGYDYMPLGRVGKPYSSETVTGLSNGVMKTIPLHGFPNAIIVNTYEYNTGIFDNNVMYDFYNFGKVILDKDTLYFTSSASDVTKSTILYK